MTDITTAMDAHGRELDRIRLEYARRSREIPRDWYSWSRPVNQFFFTQLLRAAVDALVEARAYPLTGASIADVGCGSGTWLLEFLQWGAEQRKLQGIDLDPERIAEARLRLPGASLSVGDAARLPWPSDSLDLVSQFTLFTSVLDGAVKAEISREMLRVLKPGGCVLWYDFRFSNPQNPNVRGIEAEEIRTLFPGCRVALRRVTLAPPIARAIAPRSWTLALLLEKVPIFRTHYLGIIRKPAIV